MEASRAARALEPSLVGGEPRGALRDFTIADAAAKSGLPLRDAEQGLHALLSEYRGHLRVTDDGDLLFRFSHGFTKPWQTKTRIDDALDKGGRALLAAGRFIVRAWISVVLVAYALIFVAIFLGLAFTKSNDDSRSNRGGIGGSFLPILFRVLSEALFWTFHPFSPMAVGYQSGWSSGPQYGRRGVLRQDSGPPFYEKVNRFFFGPEEAKEDPRAPEQRLLEEIRAQKGRIGVGDVMRITGLPRDQADPLMARLMLDYDGDVEVSEEGGIFYRFESIRKTVLTSAAPRRGTPIWARVKELLPWTGNEPGSNLAIAALNGFNLLMSYAAIQGHFTIARLTWMLRGVPAFRIPLDGTPIVLGVVPFVFSLALFALPLLRGALRPLKRRKLAEENARRAVLREVLTGIERGKVTDEALTKAWRDATGREADSKEITREVVSLGGDVEVDEAGKVRYRFADLEAEAAALQAEREAASEAEARVGKVVFSSEN